MNVYSLKSCLKRFICEFYKLRLVAKWGRYSSFKLLIMLWISIMLLDLCWKWLIKFYWWQMFHCINIFGSRQWYINSKSKSSFWSIAPSVVNIYLVMNGITWAQTTVNNIAYFPGMRATPTQGKKPRNYRTLLPHMIPTPTASQFTVTLRYSCSVFKRARVPARGISQKRSALLQVFLFNLI